MSGVGYAYLVKMNGYQWYAKTNWVTSGRVYFFGGPNSDTFINNAPLRSWAYGYGGNDVFYGGKYDDHLFGGGNNDSLYGGGSGDELDGGDGIDTLHGEAGNDTLRGGRGIDFLYGGIDNDTLDGGDDYDRDYMTGGAGRDTFVTKLWWVSLPSTRDNFYDYNGAWDYTCLR